MPNSNHYVLCPYYENEKNESISCEDVIRTFPNLKKKEWYMKTYCDANWQECVFAEAMNRAYAEGRIHPRIGRQLAKYAIEGITQDELERYL